MQATVLPLPPRLLEMMTDGRWPSDHDKAIGQNLKPLIDPERIALAAPGEHNLFLLPPPFYTVRELSEHNDFWRWPEAAPSGIDPDLAVDIGDFGMGSDAPILLDYRESPENPRVLRLLWCENRAENRWITMADDFPAFIEALGL